MAAMPDWSSLPPVVVRRIADSLLDTNDLDCYMDLRAVCPKWRSATDDPRNSSELRFRPHRWIIIDEVVESHSRLMVNTVSGRAVRKDLPMLGNYFMVATTHGGFFVLAVKELPPAAAVLNPFTGHMIRFEAPVPSGVDFPGAALCGLFTGKLSTSYCFPGLGSSRRGRSSPTLVLLRDCCYDQYTAVPGSGSFTLDFEDEEYGFCFVSIRLAVASGIFAADGWQRTQAPLPAEIVHKISYLMRQFAIDPKKMFSDEPATGSGSARLSGTVVHANQFFLVESAGKILAVIKLKKHMKVFRLYNANRSHEVKPVRSIGGRAIFIGYRRCLSVAPDKFPSILADCVYHVKSAGSSMDIYRYDLVEEKEERVSEAIDSLNPATLSSSNTSYTIVQLLSSYTTNVRESQLFAMERLRRQQLPQDTFMVRGH